MGAFAAVGASSPHEPQLIVLRYDPPGARDDFVLGLVGKAVTFDSGGLALKPPLRMQDMKGDMAGGAAVIEGLAAVAELGLPVRALGVVGSTENVLGGASFRAGDILRASNGKTIEIMNTDAEGRLILADALHYARRAGSDAHRRLRDADGRDVGGTRRRVRGLVRERRRLGCAHRGRDRDERRSRLPLPAASALSQVHRLDLRRHEERLRVAQRRAACSLRRSCRSSRATGHGRTSTWRAPATSRGSVPTTRSTRAAPATASG